MNAVVPRPSAPGAGGLVEREQRYPECREVATGLSTATPSFGTGLAGLASRLKDQVPVPLIDGVGAMMAAAMAAVGAGGTAPFLQCPASKASACRPSLQTG